MKPANRSPIRSFHKTACAAVFSLVAFASTSLGAVVIEVSRSLSISDNDSVDTGDAGFAANPEVIGGTSTTLISPNQEGILGYRVTGFNSGRGVNNTNQQVRSITQTVNFWVEWNVSADAGETYSFTLTPEFHGFLNILDDSADESDDFAGFSNFAATLTVNGVTQADTLDLAGGSRATAGSSQVDSNATQTWGGLTGTNTIRLQYVGTVGTAWKIAGLQNNRTASAALWGQDGTMDGDSFIDSFDNYPNSTARVGDGFFIDATTTLTAIPEPAACLLSVAGLALFLRRRR